MKKKTKPLLKEKTKADIQQWLVIMGGISAAIAILAYFNERAYAEDPTAPAPLYAPSSLLLALLQFL